MSWMTRVPARNTIMPMSSTGATTDAIRQGTVDELGEAVGMRQQAITACN